MQEVQDPVIPDFVKKYQIVSTYKEIDEIMKSSDFRQGGEAVRATFFRDTMMFLEGSEHRRQKSQLMPLMSREAMAYYELHLLDPVVAAVKDTLKLERDANGVVRTDIVPLIRVMLRQISARVTGVDGVDTPERIEQFGRLAAKIGAATAGQFAVDQSKVIGEGTRALWEMAELFLQPSLDRRKDLAVRFKAGGISKEELPRDMLMTLCLADDLSREDDGEAEIPYVWRQCALFLNASIQTSSHMLPHVFVHLEEWIGERPDDRAKLTEVEFLHAAIAELLRLHQSSPVRFRVANHDLTLSTGRPVKGGETLALYAPPANLETEIFGADARSFNPYRETPPGKSPWGMTFGAGPHLCLGRNLVTGVQGRSDEKYGSEGTAVKIVRAFYDWGCRLDPERPPVRNTESYHDAYESVPVILSTL